MQREADKLERIVKEWIESRTASTHALQEKHNKNKAMEARAKQQLIASGKAITKGWSEDQCIGRAAVLVMIKVINFSKQSLALAYGLLDSEHFNLQHEAAIEKMLDVNVESAGAPTVQLAKMSLHS